MNFKTCLDSGKDNEPEPCYSKHSSWAGASAPPESSLGRQTPGPLESGQAQQTT